MCRALRILQEQLAKEVPTRAGSVALYWSTRGYITQYEDLLFHNSRIVVPPPLQRRTWTELIHAGHQGIEQFWLRVSPQCAWWPGMMTQVSQKFNNAQSASRNPVQGGSHCSLHPFQTIHGKLSWPIATSLGCVETSRCQWTTYLSSSQPHHQPLCITSVLISIFSCFSIPEVVSTMFV